MKNILVKGFVGLFLLCLFWSIIRWILIFLGVTIAIAALVLYFSKGNQQALREAEGKEKPSLPEVTQPPIYTPKNFAQESVASLKNPEELRLVITPDETYCLQEGQRIAIPAITGYAMDLDGIPSARTGVSLSGQSPASQSWTQEELEKMEVSELVQAVESAYRRPDIDLSLRRIARIHESLIDEQTDIPEILDDHLRNLLLQYAALERKQNRTEREEAMVLTIGEGLNTVEEALENLYDRNVDRKAIEIETDIEAMEMKLRADGLLDSEFESCTDGENSREDQKLSK